MGNPLRSELNPRASAREYRASSSGVPPQAAAQRYAPDPPTSLSPQLCPPRLPLSPGPRTPYRAGARPRVQVVAGRAASAPLLGAEGRRGLPPRRTPACGPPTPPRGMPAPPRPRPGHVGPTPGAPLTCAAAGKCAPAARGSETRIGRRGRGRAELNFALSGFVRPGLPPGARAGRFPHPHRTSGQQLGELWKAR
ncbi:putative uncharacterized protein C1orf229 [Eschrichtius robustus]|uniref:putative uncharacterized protein C1orf229 n=1 Tax=Eschrichtius robustus TaxID=9764 RepID=UPI0035BFEF34